MSIIKPTDHGGIRESWQEDNLTEPGSTPQRNRASHSTVTGVCVVNSINTNVKVKLEGSLDGTNWYDISSESTITANGTHVLTATVDSVFVKFTFVSEAGGTDAIVKPRLLLTK